MIKSIREYGTGNPTQLLLVSNSDPNPMERTTVHRTPGQTVPVDYLVPGTRYSTSEAPGVCVEREKRLQWMPAAATLTRN